MKLFDLKNLAFLIIVCISTVGSLQAAEMLKMEVKRKGKRFYLDSSLLVDVPKNTMYEVSRNQWWTEST